MKQSVTKAIFPIAGLGTRFLPATKAIPKEILTLVDKPLIQYAVDEAREAGIEEFIFVTARGKSALEDYFDSAPMLEAALEAKGKTDLLEALRASTLDSGAIAHVRQREARGLGHAVWCARRLVGDEPFAVILPDDVIAGPRGCMAQMIDAHREVGGSLIAAMEVPHEAVSSYGILDVGSDTTFAPRIRGMVEKPSPDAAPSNLAAIGRYILDPAIMRRLDTTRPGAGGEIQLTDAVAAEIAASGRVFGYRFQGERFDCGSKIGFLKATVALALAREDLGAELGDFLETYRTEARFAA